MASRENERRAAFKKTLGEEDGRRRREETTRQIRKSKREEQLAKRRQKASDLPPAASVSSFPSSETKARATVADIPALKAALTSPHSTMEQLVEATRGFRRILSVDRDPPVDAVLQAGIIPNLVANLTSNIQGSTLIFESAWALTNIASTSSTHVVVDFGAIPPLVQLLRHENHDVRDQAAWCLGNIAGDKTEYRDMLLQNGVVEPLVLNLLQPANMDLLNNVTWTISNLCRGKPSPDMYYVSPLIGPLSDLLHKQVSVDVLVDAVWALSYLSDGPNERIEKVMQGGVVNKLMDFLADKSTPLLMPTIRCLGNFVTGSDLQTQAVVDAGILGHLSELLDHPRRTIRKETCWLASNIAAGTHAQIASLLAEKELINKLVATALDSPWETKKEALWTLSNVCTTGSDDHVRHLMQDDGLQPLAAALNSKNADITVLSAALDAIERVLDVGEAYDEDYTLMFDSYSGIDSLELLQEHPSTEIYEKAIKIIETYFGAEDKEDENLAPITNSAGTFGFGISSPKQLFPNGDAQAKQQVFQFGNVANRTY